MKKAERELEELRRKTEAKAEAAENELKTATENKKAVLSAKAAGRMDKAAAIIAERIVNG